MTRNWNNDSAHSGLTEETRSAMRLLETDLTASYGARHASYSLTFANFTAGVAPLFTLQLGETITKTWAIVTAAFDGTPTPTLGLIVPTAAPTLAGTPAQSVCEPSVVTPKSTGNALYTPDTPDPTAYSPVSAAVPLSFLLCDSPAHDPSVGSATGAVTIHVIITNT